jgi:phosphoribosyl-ATP pyrophosphohydrolase
MVETTDTLARLAETIAARRRATADESYVASLFAKGLPKIAQKLGEEAVETVIAALSGDAEAITGEAADLIFHLMVTLEATGVPLANVLAELDRRDGVSGLAEKAARGAPPPTAPLPIPATAAPEPELHPTLSLGGGIDEDRPRIRKG